MSERCSDCGRPFATTAFEETSLQFCNGAKSYSCLRAKLTKLEAVVEAADEVVRISDREHEAWVAYRSAKAELERVR